MTAGVIDSIVLRGRQRMTGTYRTLDLTDTFERMPEVATVLRPIIELDDPDPDRWDSIPHLAAIGPEYVSSERAIMLRSDLPIWDVNGYYRALGITSPYRPSKRELAAAYLRIDGPNDEFATYAFKRLLDRDFREFYDSRELGQPVDDIYLWRLLSRKGARWAQKETLRTGRTHKAEDYIPDDIREKMKKQAEEESRPERRLAYAPSNVVDWPYGYYLWDTRYRDDRQLAAWQELVTTSLWNRGLRRKIAVGYVGAAREADAVRYRLQHPDVEAVLLREGLDPTPELADVVVGTFYSVPELDHAVPLFIQFPRVNNLVPVVFPREESEDMTTVTDEEDIDFATGGIAGEEAVKVEREARKAARGQTGYFSLKDDGDTAIIRFLTPEPEWIRVKQHSFVATKPAPADKPSDRNWPEKVGAICRYTPRPNGQALDSYCYICENVKNDYGKLHFPRDMYWALAASRISVIGDEELVKQGRIHESQIGQKLIIDDADEVDELDANGNTTGRKVWRKKILIVNMPLKEFFSPLITMAKLLGSVTDRDFAIVRKGKAGEKHSYDAVDLGSPRVLVATEGGGTEEITYDTADPRIAALYDGHGMTFDQMRKMVIRRTSKQYYGFYFDPRVSVSWKDYYDKGGDGDDSNSSSTAAAPAAQPTAEQQAGNVATAEPAQGVAADRLAEMRRQVMEAGGQVPAAGAEQQNAAAAPPAAAAAPPPAAPPAPAPIPSA